MRIRSRARLQDVLVLLLVVVVIALIALAARHGPSAGTAAAPTPSHTAKPSKPMHPAVRQVQASTLRSAGADPVPLLSEFGRHFALVAVPGCQRAPQIATSTDGLRSFQSATAPAAYVLAIRATATRTAFAVGAGQTCQPVLFETQDGARTWAVASTSVRAWLALPSGVRSPSGKVTKPCAAPHREPLALASSRPRTAIVMCRKGLMRTNSAGARWVSAGRLPKGRPADLALAPDGRGILLLFDQGTCLGSRVMLTKDAGRHWTSGDCLLRAQLPELLALNANGQGTAYSSSGTYNTSDFGRHWH